MMTGGRLLNEAGLLRSTGLREIAAELLVGPHGGASVILTRVLNSEDEYPG